jgi:uncharacterized protein (DUF1778 family)
MATATFSVQLTDENIRLIEEFAERSGISVSDFISQSVLERLEDECDLIAYERAREEFEKNPVTYTLAEVERELGFS